MPRERIPQDELLRRESQSQQRAPDNGGCGLGETISTLLTFACPTRFDSRKEILRFDPAVRLSPEENALGSDGDSGEMTAAVPKRFADHCESGLFESQWSAKRLGTAAVI